MKLFYTDSLAAAYMAREFDVKIYVNSQNDIWSSTSLAAIDPLADKYKLYIHPDSYSIFEPQLGDIIEYEWHCMKGKDGWAYEVMDIATQNALDEYKTDKYRNIEIIKRNNKHFFAPEVQGV